MGGFHQPYEFVSRNHRHRLLASAADNHDLAIIRHAVQYGSETLSQIGIGCFCQVVLFDIVQETCTLCTITLKSPSVSMSPNIRLERVLAQLSLYEHPLLDFSARAKGEGVELIIQFKNPRVPVHTYLFDLHPRDLDHPQFEWSFQRQLYDCLHDYLVEMFIRTPQDRLERQREGL
jgi:hypothetical protein